MCLDTNGAHGGRHSLGLRRQPGRAGHSSDYLPSCHKSFTRCKPQARTGRPTTVAKAGATTIYELSLPAYVPRVTAGGACGRNSSCKQPHRTHTPHSGLAKAKRSDSKLQTKPLLGCTTSSTRTLGPVPHPGHRRPTGPAPLPAKMGRRLGKVRRPYGRRLASSDVMGSAASPFLPVPPPARSHRTADSPLPRHCAPLGGRAELAP